MDIRSSFLLSCLVLSAAAVNAEGLYVAGAVGESHFSNTLGSTKLQYTLDNEVGLPATSSKFDKNDSAYKFQLGYKFSENFALEAGYVNLGKQKITIGLDDALNGITGSGHETMKVSGINADAVLLLPINAGFSMLFKLGVLDARIKENFDISLRQSVGGFVDFFNETDSSNIHKRVANFGAGVDYNFYKGASVRLEIERYNDVGDKRKTGTTNIDLASLGLSYTF